MKTHKSLHAEGRRRLSAGAVWAILTMALVTGLALNYGEGQRCRRIRAEEELAVLRSATPMMDSSKVINTVEQDTSSFNR